MALNLAILRAIGFNSAPVDGVGQAEAIKPEELPLALHQL